MKKVYLVNAVEAIDVFDGDLFTFLTKKVEEINYVKQILVTSFYAKSKARSIIVYQEKKFSEFNLINKSKDTKCFPGEFNVHGAVVFKGGLVVFNKATETFNWINSKDLELNDLGFYYKKTGTLGEWLFNKIGEEFTFYSIQDEKEVLKLNIKTDFVTESMPKSDIFSFRGLIYFPLENGHLLAVNLSNGGFAWKLAGDYERFGLYEDKIYTIGNYQLTEVDANSGRILRQTNIKDTFDVGFRPTGEIMPYENYVFCLSIGKEGQIAIYDRKTLTLKEVLKVGSLIPYGKDNLIWHDSKLFVLDFNKTLHIYEA